MNNKNFIKNISDFSGDGVPNIYRLAFNKCIQLELTDFELFVLFGFINEDECAVLDFILGATKDQIKNDVLEHEITDNKGNLITEENFCFSDEYKFYLKD
jgi:hypothetical protein